MGIIRLKNTRWGLGAGDWAQGGDINFKTAILCKVNSVQETFAKCCTVQNLKSYKSHEKNVTKNKTLSFQLFHQ